MDLNAFSKVEIFVSARGLADLDLFSKSDPMCCLHERDGIEREGYQLVDRSVVRREGRPPVTADLHTHKY